MSTLKSRQGTTARGANNDVARFMAIRSFLRNLGLFKADSNVEWDRAHLQAVKGDENRDAAHHLPCQILIDRRHIWDLGALNNVNIDGIILELRKLFGGVLFPILRYCFAHQ